MTRQTTEPLLDWRLNVSQREAYGVVTSMLDQLDLTPPYQRGDVWTSDQRIALVRSWLMGIPVPAVILNNRDNPGWEVVEGSIYGNGRAEQFKPTWAVVDGKQRIETALRWFTSRLPVPASWFGPDWVAYTQATDDGSYVAYDGLTAVARRFVAHRFQLPVVEAKLPNLRSGAELYLLINGGGTPQSEADMAHAARVAGSEYGSCPIGCVDLNHHHLDDYH